MKQIFIAFLLFFIAMGSVIAQKEPAKIVYTQKDFVITTLPRNADIIELTANNTEQKLGNDSVEVRFEKDVNHLIEVRKDGYQSVRRTYIRQKGGVEEDKIELTTRLIKINVSPSDAKIFVGGTEKAIGTMVLTLTRGSVDTVEVRKTGFKSQSKVFYNTTDGEEPEITSTFKLEDRQISLKTIPEDATIIADGKKAGEGTADIIVKKNSCVSVAVEHSGFVTKTVTFCNKEGEKEPPLNQEITLQDRVSQFKITPESAKIIADGRELSKGSASVKIPYGNCVEVMIEDPGYARQKFNLCNKADNPAPESTYQVKMAEDEAYSQSEEGSDIANKNFSVEVSPDLDPIEAWKKLASIIQSYFDNIENQDATTSYLKTNWESSKPLNEKFGMPQIIRTKVVVTSGSTSPLRYNVKIFSEISKIKCNSGSEVPPVSRDECFEPFSRIFRKYNTLINELQQRLKVTTKPTTTAPAPVVTQDPTPKKVKGKK